MKDKMHMRHGLEELAQSWHSGLKQKNEKAGAIHLRYADFLKGSTWSLNIKSLHQDHDACLTERYW